MSDVKIPVEVIIGKSFFDTVHNQKEPETQLEAMAQVGTGVIEALKKHGYKITKMRVPKKETTA